MYEDNILINLNVIKICHLLNVKKTIMCLTTCAFPERIEQYPMTEEMLHFGEPHNSNFGYAYSKRMVEVHTRLYNQIYGQKFVCVIPTNIYGAHDNFSLEESHVIPALIHKCYLAKKNNTPFIIRGSGNVLRQFIYSRDMAKIIEYILYHKTPDNLILAPDEDAEISIKELVYKIAQIFDFKGEIIFEAQAEEGQYKKTASNAKLQQCHKFQFTSLDDGLTETIKWFNENYPNVRL